ncbi:MAG: EAL domain-containing protein [Rhodospirillales bacterium]|nr:EAL domain-containing protein [Rhodospirillales bacterium]
MDQPRNVIPLAEETGLILPLGRWVMEAAVRLALNWPTALEAGTVAVNVSPAQFAHDDIVAQAMAVIERTGFPAHRLELEVTEGLLMRDDVETIAQMQELNACGVHFSIDDFGTGHSSLCRLKQLPVNKLKVDQSFVRSLDTDADDEMIARTVLALGQGLGLETLAEGIETPDQLALLNSWGCNAGQGFLLARPMPASALPAFLETTSPPLPLVLDASSHAKSPPSPLYASRDGGSAAILARTVDHSASFAPQARAQNS